MKVIFLDIDGVLNSEASMRYEAKRKNIRASETLSPIACANLQYILEQDSAVKLVISSTWKHHYTRVQLQNILNANGVDGARIIGFTPSTVSGDRAHEINLALQDMPNVTVFVVLDDDPQVLGVKDDRGAIFMTTPEDGLLFSQAKVIAALFRAEDKVAPK